MASLSHWSGPPDAGSGQRARRADRITSTVSDATQHDIESLVCRPPTRSFDDVVQPHRQDPRELISLDRIRMGVDGLLLWHGNLAKFFAQAPCGGPPTAAILCLCIVERGTTSTGRTPAGPRNNNRVRDSRIRETRNPLYG